MDSKVSSSSLLTGISRGYTDLHGQQGYHFLICFQNKESRLRKWLFGKSTVFNECKK
jgi:hypothetical protein